MKAALARKTGRSEDELCLEERRRSTRVCVAEDETLPNSSFLENGSSRQRKDELKIYEVVHHLSCNITEFAILLLTYAAAYRLCMLCQCNMSSEVCVWGASLCLLILTDV